MVENGEFRADLYYRLNAMPIHLPPLRERQADIDLIAERLLDELCIRLHLPVKYLTPDAINLLCQHSWPGNVRELQNLLERAVIMAEEHTEIDVQLIQPLLVPTAQFQQTAQTQPISPRIDPNTGLPIYTLSSANRLSPLCLRPTLHHNHCMNRLPEQSVTLLKPHLLTLKGIRYKPLSCWAYPVQVCMKRCVSWIFST